jgi:hypothetical protein
MERGGSVRSKCNAELSEAQQIVCDLLASHLFGQEIPIGSETDWRAILEESYLQGVHTIMGQLASKNGAPPPDTHSLATIRFF